MSAAECRECGKRLEWGEEFAENICLACQHDLPRGYGEELVAGNPYRLMWRELVNHELVYRIYFQHFASWQEAMRKGNELLESSIWNECEFTIIKVMSQTVVAGEKAK